MTSPAAQPVEGAASDYTGATAFARHVSEGEYGCWVSQFIPHPHARAERMRVYRRFVERWPNLQAWRDAPLPVRLGFDGGPLVADKRNVVHQASSYLVYLALVRGIPLPADYLLGRKYARLFSVASGVGGYDVDLSLFESHVNRLHQLGYPLQGSRQRLTWGLGRLLLMRGDPDISAITDADLYSLSNEIRSFAERPDFRQLREALLTTRGPLVADAVHGFRRTHLSKLHAVNVLLFNIGQVSTPPTRGTEHHQGWRDRLLPEPCAPAIREVIERYLTLRLEANLDRPQTVRLAREALRRLVTWLAAEHPSVTSLSQLDRELIEQYMRWLPTHRSKLTGQPLAVTTIKHEINAIGAFCRDTAIWGWTEVPGRPLVSTRDSPRRPETIPRYLPQHDLDALMDAVTALPDRHQRAALLVLRWSGARRDEVRRLPTDCLDTYPGGHPRLRIPVGKGHAERIIPLHPVAAAALQEVISLAEASQPIGRQGATTGRVTKYVFVRRGKLLSATSLFDDAFRTACTDAGLVDDNGVPSVSAHRLRHTLGTQLAEGGARIQTIMAILGHRSTSMAMIYTRISDPEIRRQYETALANGQRIAGPAAEALLYGQIDQESLNWLQTNFLKTELELGHCLRLPAEGPCECDLVLSCPKFLTTSDYAPRLRTRLEVEQTLIDDAAARGWPREIERHQATARRLRALLHELNDDP